MEQVGICRGKRSKAENFVSEYSYVRKTVGEYELPGGHELFGKYSDRKSCGLQIIRSRNHMVGNRIRFANTVSSEACMNCSRKLKKNLLDGSASFVGARLFDSHDFEKFEIDDLPT